MNTSCLRQKQRGTQNWRLFYIAVHKSPPSYLAKLALGHVTSRGTALDLGSGAFNDSKLFLDAGFSHVTAVDQSQDLIPYIPEMIEKYGSRFRFKQQTFQDVSLEPESFDLVHSNFALPYHGQNGFEDFIRRVKSSLRPSGIFSGIFFGKKDDWQKTSCDVASVTKAQLEEMFTDFDLVCPVNEVELEISDTRHPMFWHYFRVVAKKPSLSRA